MSRWFPTAVLVGALVLSAGCGSSPTTGPGKPGSATAGSDSGKPSETGHGTAKTSARTHDPR